MSNYAVSGNLSEAASALYRAAGAVRTADHDSPEGKLRDRILRAQATVESIEKAAKKLIPGGFKSAPNAREDDKRTQREEFRAFTLPELLVVIATIALLIAILGPPLAGARQATRETACTANLRSIRQGIEAYQADRPWILPPAAFAIMRPGATAPTTTPSLEQYLGLGWDRHYFCPSTTDHRDAPDQSSYRYAVAAGPTAFGAAIDFRKATSDREHNALLPLLTEQGPPHTPQHRGGRYTITAGNAITWNKPTTPTP